MSELLFMKEFESKILKMKREIQMNTMTDIDAGKIGPRKK